MRAVRLPEGAKSAKNCRIEVMVTEEMQAYLQGQWRQGSVAQYVRTLIWRDMTRQAGCFTTSYVDDISEGSPQTGGDG